MKKVLLFLMILFLLTYCGKKGNADKKNNEENMNVQSDRLNGKNEINFDTMKKIIDNSDKLDMDVFLL